jgi:molybdopterin adenylyltransferase
MRVRPVPPVSAGIGADWWFPNSGSVSAVRNLFRACRESVRLNPGMQIQTGIITISDRASRGLYDDLGGPALKSAAAEHGWAVLDEALVPDEKAEIQRAVRSMAAKGCQLILTTGGTGVALRDVTPEAVREIAVRELPGFGEVMRMESLKITRNAILSRCLAAVVDRSLVVCLPGKPRGAVECLGFVAAAIPHCVEVIQEVPTSC